MALTTPPIACEPYRNVAGPRTTSMRSAENGSIGTAWSSLSAETSCEPMPFSCTRTRLLSRPRITGRLAPAAKFEAVIPGRYCRESARFDPGVLVTSFVGTIVRDTNASSATMPAGGGGADVASAADGAFVAGAAVAGVLTALGDDLATGLGVVTTMPGS